MQQANVRQCSYFELALPVDLHAEIQDNKGPDLIINFTEYYGEVGGGGSLLPWRPVRPFLVSAKRDVLKNFSVSRDQKCPPWNANCQNPRLCTRTWKINWRKKKTLIWPNDLNSLTSIRWLDLISLLKLLLSLHTSVCSDPLTAGFPR